MINHLSILKKKTLSCNAKALTITLIVHALVLIFAGSIGVYHHIQKRRAEFTVSTATPKLERRQLQLPAKLERVQETSRQPKIVSRQISSASPAFTAPDMGRIGTISAQRFELPKSGRASHISAIPRGFGSDLPQIRFFGLRAQGEKIIFIVDVSENMLDEPMGGTSAAEFIKESIYSALEQMTSSILFNVILHDGNRVLQFRPQMVPAVAANREAVKEWLAPVNLDPQEPGLNEDQNNYVPPHVYETPVGPDGQGWLRALQSALEKRADTVFMVGPDWGTHPLSLSKRQMMLDFSLWEIFGGEGRSSIGGSPILREERLIRNELIRQAADMIVREDRTRPRNRTDFVRDILDHIEYSEKQILDHVDLVYHANYLPFELARPQIHYVRQIAGANPSVEDVDTAKIRTLTRNFGGNLAFYRGQDAVVRGSLLSQPAVAGQAVEAEAAAEQPPAPSDVRFFGTRERSSQTAFVLDLTPRMFKKETGGTNSVHFIKNQIVKTVAEMNPGTRFNVIVYDENETVLFRPVMTPAADSSGLHEWLNTFGQAADDTAVHTDRIVYLPETEYPGPIGKDATLRLGAVQAAMEQQADSILLVSTGPGYQPVSREKAERLINFSILNALGSTSVEGGGGDAADADMDDDGTIDSAAGLLEQLRTDRRMRDRLIRQALRQFNDEKKARERAGVISVGTIPDIINYIGYLPEHIITHLNAVTELNYRTKGMDDPRIHFIHLTEMNTPILREDLRHLTLLTEAYGGSLRIFEGAETDERIINANRLLGLQP